MTNHNPKTVQQAKGKLLSERYSAEHKAKEKLLLERYLAEQKARERQNPTRPPFWVHWDGIDTVIVFVVIFGVWFCCLLGFHEPTDEQLLARQMNPYKRWGVKTVEETIFARPGDLIITVSIIVVLSLVVFGYRRMGWGIAERFWEVFTLSVVIGGIIVVWTMWFFVLTANNWTWG